MGLMQRDANATYFKGQRSHVSKNEKVTQELCVTEDSDAQDDRKWDCAFANSQDTLARLAAQSRANREAGKTKRIKS